MIFFLKLHYDVIEKSIFQKKNIFLKTFFSKNFLDSHACPIRLVDTLKVAYHECNQNVGSGIFDFFRFWGFFFKKVEKINFLHFFEK